MNTRTSCPRSYLNINASATSSGSEKTSFPSFRSMRTSLPLADETLRVGTGKLRIGPALQFTNGITIAYGA